MAQDIREALIGLFGEEKAPAVPRTKAELLALPMQQRMAIEQRIPDFYEGLAADPESLPAAVALRYEKNELKLSDASVLAAHGMPATALDIQRKAMDAQLAEVVARTEAQRQRRELDQNDINTRHKRAQQLSRWGITGEV